MIVAFSKLNKMEGQNVKKRAFGKAAISKINAAAIKI